VTPICLGPSISETAGDRDLVTMDVTWLWNVKVFTSMLFEANISKTARSTGFVPKDHQ